MNAQKHTQGPWSIEQQSTCWINCKDGSPIASVRFRQADDSNQSIVSGWRVTDANAKRIVTCVNALDGLSQDALDGGWNFKDQGAYTVRVESQRNDLLKALTDLRDAIEAGKEPALADANMAIRKAGAV